MISIAIDGPAGAGKSTIAKAIAEKLSYIYVDTGALYRAVAFYVITHNIFDLNNLILSDLKINLKYINNCQEIFLNNINITDKIRNDKISTIASKVAKIPKVRNFLLELQREITNNNNIVMDGRDIGTVVIPNATVKIFLTASAEIRAKRRYAEFVRQKINCNFEDVLNNLIERDNNDLKRDVAPLKAADDAIVIDTSDYNLKDSINLILKVIIEKLKN